MIYHDFNKKAFEFYISRSASTFFTFSIDSREFEDLIAITELTQFEILKHSWNNLLDIKDSIPQYFGLIAIQCYAASEMQDDGHNSAAAYIVRLANVLSIPEKNVLQNLFSGNDIANPIQEQIWWNAKTFLKEQFNLILNLPERISYAGRFVQYPKSQALLNKEDLKRFTLFFYEEFQKNEKLSFQFFTNHLNKRFGHIITTPRTLKLWEDEEKRLNCIKQVYDFYTSWDGEVYSSRKKTYESKKSIQKSIASKIILSFTKSLPEFFVVYQETFEDLIYEKIFNVTNYKYIHSGLIILKEMDYIPNEFEDSRFLYKGHNHYILIDANLRLNESAYLENNTSFRIQLSDNLILYKYEFEAIDIESPFSNLIYCQQVIKLSGGLKINRKNEYLKGYGPSIICSSQFFVIYQYQKCTYVPETAEPGLYKVRSENNVDISFTILESETALEIIPLKFIGWNLKSFRLDEKYDLEGCYLQSHLQNEDIHRIWIDLSLKRSIQSKYNGNNMLIKAIKQSLK